MEVTDICPLCGLEREDTFHVFCRCPRAVHLWRTMAEVWSIPDIESVRNTGPEWLLNLIAESNEGDRLRLIMLLWRCWHVRNEITHDKPAPPVEVSRRFLQSYVTSLLGIQEYPQGDWDKGKMTIQQEGAEQPISHVGGVPRTAHKWSPPPANWTKLNVDGSFSHDDGRAGTGMVLRDQEGAIIFSACRSLWSCPDPLHAELAGCMEGIALALQWTELSFIVECDSLQAVQLINASGQDQSQYAMVVSEVKHLMSERECHVIHISREQNNVSHTLANFGRTEDRTVVWLRSSPDNIPSLCREDLLGS